MEKELEARLKLSVDAGRLVVVCGAGLSMAPPSCVPSARALAQKCYERYRRIVGTNLPPPFANDIERQAKHFLQSGQFSQVFIHQLMPWEDFDVDPNRAHEAIADFIGCSIIECAVTTNLDALIETALSLLGGRGFQGSVSIETLVNEDLPIKPLIKIHGCLRNDRAMTLWCPDQLSVDKQLADRISGLADWLVGHLSGKDIIFIGFWSDWAYLNNILQTCLGHVKPKTVILVDPLGLDELKEKAPGLWAWAKATDHFTHLAMKGEDFLDELRRLFSVDILRKLCEDAVQEYKQVTGKEFRGENQWDANKSSTELYNLRRDFEGVTRNEIAGMKRHSRSHQLVGALHLVLIEEGAVIEDGLYISRGKRIRLLNGAGQTLSAMKERFSKEIPSPTSADIVVCAGSKLDYSTSNIARSQASPNIVRGGLQGRWVTEEQFLSGNGGTADGHIG